MSNQVFIAMIAAGMLMAAAAGAQETTVNSSDPNEIFNSIMQTMPDEMKARIDSAASVQRSQKATNRTNAATFEDKKEPPASLDAKRASLDKLPEDVREQVRKTMRELERENSERMLQFKEIQNQNNVK